MELYTYNPADAAAHSPTLRCLLAAALARRPLALRALSTLPAADASPLAACASYANAAPVLVGAGDAQLYQSNAIVRFMLADSGDAWLGRDALERARVDALLDLVAHTIEPALAFLVLRADAVAAANDAARVNLPTLTDAQVDAAERHVRTLLHAAFEAPRTAQSATSLRSHTFLVGDRLSAADVALYAATRRYFARFYCAGTGVALPATLRLVRTVHAALHARLAAESRSLFSGDFADASTFAASTSVAARRERLALDAGAGAGDKQKEPEQQQQQQQQKRKQQQQAKPAATKAGDAPAAAAAAAAAAPAADDSDPFVNADGTPMNEKQIEKKKKAMEKQRKFDEKQAKLAAQKAAAPAGPSKSQQKRQKGKPSTAADAGSDKKKDDGAVDASAAPTIRLRTAYDNPTPDGERKDVAAIEMHATYDPPRVEAAWYSWWQKEGMFTPSADVPPAFDGARNDEPAEYAAQRAERAKVFTIALPPPNVTGQLHIGHALAFSVQDCLVRWHRARGETTLWVPGVDHAGISCQSVVEKQLAREGIKSRHELGREAFLQRVWQWKDDYGHRITEQLKRTGASLDFSRFAFTMDERRSEAVLEAFSTLFERGLIYRASRLVNWCVALQTAISDVEVDHVDVDGPTQLTVPSEPEPVEVGVLHHFAYRLARRTDEHDAYARRVADGASLDELAADWSVDAEVDTSPDTGGEVVVATTRLETMLADTGVAVHPDDERYKHLHGRFLVHPFCPRRVVRIVTDATLVKMEFGTGCVKVTPAHDPNDFACGTRQRLPQLNMLNDDGTLNALCPAPFAGMRRFEARRAVLAAMKSDAGSNAYRQTTPNPMSIGVCARSKDIIEPLIKPQWWVDCKDMAADAVAAVRSGELEITPAFYKDTWYGWLENIRDWCISRQLWWGHRIPAYACVLRDAKSGAELPVDNTRSSSYVVAHSDAEALEKARAKHGADAVVRVEQDPDVLDTWFSSALFPFAIAGWPRNDTVTRAELERFYPNSVLQTGHDILFFWVARMVMMGKVLMGRLPFSKVLLNAMVRDSHGKKMSKSRGNVVDPIDVIEGITLEQMAEKMRRGNIDPKELARALDAQKKDFPDGISECGTDALRFGLLHHTSNPRDINLHVPVLVTFRNFCNKMWNAHKFATMCASRCAVQPFVPRDELSHALSGRESPQERWILSRLAHCVATVDEAIGAFELARAVDTTHSFCYSELCDVFVEAAKPLVRSDDDAVRESCAQTLYTCIETALRLLQPTMPFLAEELWQRLPRRPKDARLARSVCLAPWPALVANTWAAPEVEADMQRMQTLVDALRGVRGEYKLTPAQKPAAYVRSSSQRLREFLSSPTHHHWPQLLGTLALASSVHFVDATAADADARLPAAAAQAIVDKETTVYIDLAGVVKPDAECRKLDTLLARLDKSIAAGEKQLENPAFRAKAKEHAIVELEKKLVAQRGEREQALASLAKWKSMM